MEEDNKKSKLEIFKYNVILSALFFLASTIYLGSKIPNYDLSKYTISEISFFLNDKQLPFFNLIFIVKCIIDLSFTFYVFKKFKLKLISFTAFIWLTAFLSFGLIGFFPESKFKIIHWFIAGCVFLFFPISQYAMAKLTKHESFKYFTNNLVVIQLLTLFLFMVFNRINGIFEIIYFLLVFFWQIIFISVFL